MNRKPSKLEADVFRLQALLDIAIKKRDEINRLNLSTRFAGLDRKQCMQLREMLQERIHFLYDGEDE